VGGGAGAAGGKSETAAAVTPSPKKTPKTPKTPKARLTMKDHSIVLDRELFSLDRDLALQIIPDPPFEPRSI